MDFVQAAFVAYAVIVSVMFTAGFAMIVEGLVGFNGTFGRGGSRARARAERYAVVARCRWRIAA